MDNAIVRSQINQELARQLGNVQLAAELTTVVVQEATELHLYGVESIGETLKTAQGVINRSFRQPALTDNQQYQIHRRTVQYLNSIAYITHRGSEQMVRLLVAHVR